MTENEKIMLGVGVIAVGAVAVNHFGKSNSLKKKTTKSKEYSSLKISERIENDKLLMEEDLEGTIDSMPLSDIKKQYARLKTKFKFKFLKMPTPGKGRKTRYYLVLDDEKHENFYENKVPDNVKSARQFLNDIVWFIWKYAS